MIRRLLAVIATAMLVTVGATTAPAQAAGPTDCSSVANGSTVKGNVVVTADCILVDVTVKGNIITKAGSGDLTILGKSSARNLVARAKFAGDLVVGTSTCKVDPTFHNVLVKGADNVLLCNVDAKKIDVMKATGRVTVRNSFAARLQFKGLKAFAGTSTHQNPEDVRVINVINKKTGVKFVEGDKNLQFLNNSPDRDLIVR